MFIYPFPALNFRKRFEQFLIPKSGKSLIRFYDNEIYIKLLPFVPGNTRSGNWIFSSEVRFPSHPPYPPCTGTMKALFCVQEFFFLSSLFISIVKVILKLATILHYVALRLCPENSHGTKEKRLWENTVKISCEYKTMVMNFFFSSTRILLLYLFCYIHTYIALKQMALIYTNVQNLSLIKKTFFISVLWRTKLNFIFNSIRLISVSSNIINKNNLKLIYN